MSALEPPQEGRMPYGYGFLVALLPGGLLPTISNVFLKYIVYGPLVLEILE